MRKYRTIHAVSLDSLANELNKFTMANELISFQVIHVDKNPLIGYEVLLEIRKTEDIGGW